MVIFISSSKWIKVQISAVSFQKREKIQKRITGEVTVLLDEYGWWGLGEGGPVEWCRSGR